MTASRQSLLGIEIGGTKLQIVRGDESLRITQRHRAAVDPATGAEGIRRQIEVRLRQMLAEAPASAIGVGFGGPVDWRTGTIRCSHQIGGWNDFELGQWLRAITGLNVFVDNDANVATLGEASAGAGVGHSPVFYTNMGSGVGGGLAVDGRLYHGIAPGEVEFGHMRLDRTGQTVESRCSGWAVDRRIRAIATSQPDSILARLIGPTPGGEAKHLGTALARNDSAARQVLSEVAEDLAFALSHAVHLFHPAIIILGGGLSLVGEPLRAAVAEALPPFVMKAFHPTPPVLLAKLAEDAVPVGALRLASLG